MEKLFLLDAYALIYRSYYAFIKNPRINSKGLNTSAIIGFCNTLNEVLQKEQPTHIGVAFDPHGPTFRSEAFPEYKAQREETPEDIRKAVPIIKEILKAYRIPILQVDGYEADDVLYCQDEKCARTFLASQIPGETNCPACKAVMRVPRGRGKIRIVCHKCGSTFMGKS